MKREDEKMPGWIKVLCLIAAILYLRWLLFFSNGLGRESFPSFRR